MELKDIMYKRQYSNLEPLQTAHELTYAIVTPEEKGAGYGVRVAEESQDAMTARIVRHISPARAGAQRLLLFLYENGVAPAELEDIVHDLFAQGALTSLGCLSEEL